MTPSDETCNGADDDCDGSEDEGCSCTYDPGEPDQVDTDRSHDAGICPGQKRDESGVCETPEAFESRTDVESECNGTDNDCDGVEDEGCPCNYNSLNNGVCRGQTRRADGSCPRPSDYEPSESTLDDGLDNDCDGRTDEVHIARVTTGADYSCALDSSGKTMCWGDSSRKVTSAPKTQFDQIEGGFWHACAIAADGSIECWGSAQFGRTKPPSGTFRELSVSAYHGCGITVSGNVQCWGRDRYGEASPPNGSFSQVSATYEHTCGLTQQDVVKCWGRDDDGESSPPNL